VWDVVFVSSYFQILNGAIVAVFEHRATANIVKNQTFFLGLRAVTDLGAVRGGTVATPPTGSTAPA
jgi:hypothetical protein